MKKGTYHGTYGTKAKSNLLICDRYKEPYGAWSLRKLISNYNGAAIRVLTQDSQEFDVGFNGVNFDVKTLKNRVKAQYATIKKWYDQSGNGRDLIQNTSSFMPGIVDSSGNVISRNNNAAIIFNGSNTHLELSSSTGINIIPKTGFVVCDRDSSINSLRTVIATGILAGENGYGLYFTDTTNLPPQDRLSLQTRFGATVTNTGYFTNTINKPELYTFIINTQRDNVMKNSSLSVINNRSVTNTTNTVNLIVGMRKSGADQRFYHSGTIQEIILYNEDMTDFMDVIDDDIIKYYFLK